MPDSNVLYFGDNLDILREHVADESVGLIYLDPPFNSNASYNVLFAEKSGEQSAAQITAFEDTWHWSLESEETYHEVVTGAGKLAEVVSAFRSFLGQNDMMAYLVMMAIRLKELHRVLNGRGSIYLHCDPTASHYLKILLDATFGPQNFCNEIVWRRSHPKGHAFTRFATNHDVIFVYTKSPRKIWNPIYTANPRADEQYRLVDENGRRYQLTSLLNPNPNRPNLTYDFKGVTKVWRWTRERMEKADQSGLIVVPKGGKGIPRFKRYLDEQEGIPVSDFWDDIPIAAGNERLGYPTQKSEALLGRIIKASSNEGDVVLDPFCGCGTAVSEAERLHRRWKGIDITHLAITLIRHRLRDSFGPELAPYQVIGDPKDLAGARALALENRDQFEWWALGLVDARPGDERKKGADRGIDGYIYFFDDKSGKPKKLVVQVKSGKVQSSQIRDLVGTMKREGSEIGAFLTLEKPTRAMDKEAATAGFYEPERFPGKRYPRLQVLTIADLLDGKEFQYPRMAPADTFKRAKRKRKAPAADQSGLPF